MGSNLHPQAPLELIKRGKQDSEQDPHTPSVGGSFWLLVANRYAEPGCKTRMQNQGAEPGCRTRVQMQGARYRWK